MESNRRLIVFLSVIAASVGIGQTSMPLAAQEASVPDKAAAGYAATLPKDVDPDSGNRFPLVKREELSELGKKVYDLSIAGTRPIPGLRGPLGILLHSPRLDEHVRNETQYLRRGSALGPRLFELAVLVTAREVNQQFAWTVHEPAALEAGLEPAIIDIVRYRKPITGLGEKEAAIIQLGREAVGKRKVSPDTFARSLKLFGKTGLVDLSSVIGYYASIGVLLDTFDQQLPPGQKPLLPMP